MTDPAPESISCRQYWRTCLLTTFDRFLTLEPSEMACHQRSWANESCLTRLKSSVYLRRTHDISSHGRRPVCSPLPRKAPSACELDSSKQRNCRFREADPGHRFYRWSSFCWALKVTVSCISPSSTPLFYFYCWSFIKSSGFRHFLVSHIYRDALGMFRASLSSGQREFLPHRYSGTLIVVSGKYLGPFRGMASAASVGSIMSFGRLDHSVVVTYSW